MPRHTLNLLIVDAESVPESIKRFLARIERPLVSIELTTQNRPGFFYGVYQVSTLDRDYLAAKIIKRIMHDRFGRVRIVVRSRS